MNLRRSQKKAQAVKLKSKDHHSSQDNSKVSYLKNQSLICAIFFNNPENKLSFFTISAEKEQKEDQILSHRQKQRLGKRLQKQKEIKIKMSGHGRKNQQKLRQKAYNSDSEEESETENENKHNKYDDSEDSEAVTDKIPGFSDENAEWLKPKNGTKNNGVSESEDETSGNESGDDEMASSSDSESVNGN